MNAIVEIAVKWDIIVTKLQTGVETESVNLNWYKIVGVDELDGTKKVVKEFLAASFRDAIRCQIHRVEQRSSDP